MFNWFKNVTCHGATIEFPAGWHFTAHNIYERSICYYYSGLMAAVGGRDNTTDYGRECFYTQARDSADDAMLRWTWGVRLAKRGKYALA